MLCMRVVVLYSVLMQCTFLSDVKINIVLGQQQLIFKKFACSGRKEEIKTGCDSLHMCTDLYLKQNKPKI